MSKAFLNPTSWKINYSTQLARICFHPSPKASLRGP